MKKLLILSGKGGSGKTTVAAAFIDFLNIKALADCDVDAPNLHLVMNMESEPEKKDYYGLQKSTIDTEKCVSCGVCMENCRFGAISLKDGEYIVDEYSCEGCGVCSFVCPSGAAALFDDKAGDQMLYKEERVFSTAQLKMGRGNSGLLVSEVKKDLYNSAEGAALAIIDGSPGIGCPVIASVTGVDLVLVVAEPSLSGIHDMERVLKTAEILGVKAAVCVNKHDVSPESTEKIKEICKSKDIAFVGCIPYDKSASKAINEGKSLAFVDCPASAAIKAVLQNTMELL